MQQVEPREVPASAASADPESCWSPVGLRGRRPTHRGEGQGADGLPVCASALRVRSADRISAIFLVILLLDAVVRASGRFRDHEYRASTDAGNLFVQGGDRRYGFPVEKWASNVSNDVHRFESGDGGIPPGAR